MVLNSSRETTGLHTPRFTASATVRRWALQLLSSLQELHTPINRLALEDALGKTLGAKPGAVPQAPAIAFAKPIAAAELGDTTQGFEIHSRNPSGNLDFSTDSSRGVIRVVVCALDPLRPSWLGASEESVPND